MQAAIFLVGLAIDPLEPVQNFYFEHVEEVKQQLIELQKGYCQDEKPKIDAYYTDNPKTNKKIMTLEAYSDSDYSYKAFLGMSIKTLPKGEKKI
jgi:hypothetical protein